MSNRLLVKRTENSAEKKVLYCFIVTVQTTMMASFQCDSTLRCITTTLYCRYVVLPLRAGINVSKVYVKLIFKIIINYMLNYFNDLLKVSSNDQK